MTCFQTTLKTNTQQYEGVQGVLNKSNKLTYILNVVARCFRFIETITIKIKEQNKRKSLHKGFESTLSQTWNTSSISKRKKTSSK